MAFDLSMIQDLYKRLEANVEEARKLVGKPLPLQKKFFTTTFGIRILKPHSHEEQIM